MNDRFDESSDEALGRRLAGELPRYPAPARLRVAIVNAATPAAPSNGASQTGRAGADGVAAFTMATRKRGGAG